MTNERKPDASSHTLTREQIVDIRHYGIHAVDYSCRAETVITLCDMALASLQSETGKQEQTAAHPTPSDPFNCPQCGAHDFGLFAGSIGACPHCLKRENAELRAQLAEVKEALAGDDYASLPSDYPLVRMAHTIRADHDKFRNQVIDTCKRAETAERQRDEALAQRGTLSYSTEGGWTPLGEQIVRLEKERDEARKDAERYRWIRQEAAKSIEDEDLSDELWAVWEFLLQGNNDPDEMDAAIDAAKSQEK